MPSTLAARYGRKPRMARARMARALATAIQAGLPLQRAVRLAADASASPEIRAYVSAIGERQLSTTSIGETLARCPHVTPEFAATVATAERTGELHDAHPAGGAVRGRVPVTAVGLQLFAAMERLEASAVA